MFDRYKKRLSTLLQPLRPLYDAWMSFIAGFSWVLVRVLLTVLFLTVFLIYGVVLRVVNKDPLRRDWYDGSYWQESNVVNNDSLEQYKKQY